MRQRTGDERTSEANVERDGIFVFRFFFWGGGDIIWQRSKILPGDNEERSAHSGRHSQRLLQQGGPALERTQRDL